MARPTRVRKIDFMPEQIYFCPCSNDKCKSNSIDVINLKIEEIEAIRLKDLMELSQEECAVKMEISRQTFQNIIEAARKKIALALTEGKAIKMYGGNFIKHNCYFKCNKCNEKYPLKVENDKKKCPKCGSKDVYCSEGKQCCKNFD